MLAAGAKFVRFNDDYRMPAGRHAEGYRRLASLADVLYRNHGLTLQPQKTMVGIQDNKIILEAHESFSGKLWFLDITVREQKPLDGELLDAFKEQEQQ
jgi:hypothetical protein